MPKKPRRKPTAKPQLAPAPAQPKFEPETEPELDFELDPDAASEPPENAKKRRMVPDRQRAFLAAYAQGVAICDAAKSARINRTTHYQWLKEDTAYAERFRLLKVQSDEALEDKAVQLATLGEFEPNVFQGRFVYPQEEYEVEPAVTDRRGRVVMPARTEWRDKPGAAPLGVHRVNASLLMFLLRGRMPEKYGRAALEVTGPGGGPIEIVQRMQAARQRMARLAVIGGESDAR